MNFEHREKLLNIKIKKFLNEIVKKNNENIQ